MRHSEPDQHQQQFFVDFSSLFCPHKIYAEVFLQRFILNSVNTCELISKKRDTEQTVQRVNFGKFFEIVQFDSQ